MFSPGPILSRAPLVENRQPEHRSPVRNRQCFDTPTPGPSLQEAPSNHRVDPTYAPSDTPRSRREMGATRETPPLTRFRSRMQSLQEASENEIQEKHGDVSKCMNIRRCQRTKRGINTTIDNARVKKGIRIIKSMNKNVHDVTIVEIT